MTMEEVNKAAVKIIPKTEKKIIKDFTKEQKDTMGF